MNECQYCSSLLYRLIFKQTLIPLKCLFYLCNKAATWTFYSLVESSFYDVEQPFNIVWKKSFNATKSLHFKPLTNIQNIYLLLAKQLFRNFTARDKYVYKQQLNKMIKMTPSDWVSNKMNEMLKVIGNKRSSMGKQAQNFQDLK